MSTTTDYLANRVRLELGDQPVPFHEEFFADGDDNQYVLEHRPIDCESFILTVDGAPFTDYQLDARHGVLLFDRPLPEGVTVMVAGVKYRYFNQEDLTVFVNEAVREHTGNRNDIYGVAVTAEQVPKVELHLIAIRATILALWALITDASFDIDINAPDGVSIPRSERYRQLMDVLMARQGEYDAMAKALNVGVFRIEVYTLRRVAKLTNRLVPLYLTQEYDDARTPTRLYTDISTQGNVFPIEAVPSIDITLRRGEYVVQDISLDRDVTALLKEGQLGAEVLRYPGQAVPRAKFEIILLDAKTGSFRLKMDARTTRAVPNNQSYWQLALRGDKETVGSILLAQGKVLAERPVSPATGVISESNLGG